MDDFSQCVFSRFSPGDAFDDPPVISEGDVIQCTSTAGAPSLDHRFVQSIDFLDGLGIQVRNVQYRNPWTPSLPKLDVADIVHRNILVGQGSYGNVYKVVPIPPELERMVTVRPHAPPPVQIALKTFKALSQRRRLAYMHRELATFQALRRSPHVVHIFGVTHPPQEMWDQILQSDDQKNNEIAAVFEWCPATFESVLHTMSRVAKVPRSTPQQLLSAIRFLALGLFSSLRDLHSLNLIHRDVKPANIMLTPAGVPRLGDFGMSRSMSLGDSGEFVAPRRSMSVVRRAIAGVLRRQHEPLKNEELSAFVDQSPPGVSYSNGPLTAGDRACTLRYRAPELFNETTRNFFYTQAVDIFAAGIVLAELLVGRHPVAPPTGSQKDNYNVNDIIAFTGMVKDDKWALNLVPQRKATIEEYLNPDQ